MSKSGSDLDITPFLPTCVDTEMALLGRLLVTNSWHGKIQHILKGEHFTIEWHQVMYDAIGQLIAVGKAADPITLKPYLVHDEESQKHFMEHCILMIDKACVGASVAQYAAEIVEYHGRREIVRAARAMILRAGVAEFGVTLADLMNDHDASIQALRPAMGGPKTGFMPMSKLAREVAFQIQEEWAGRVKRNTLSTGYEAIDNLIGGLEEMDVLVIAGRPASGKTSLGVDIVFNAAREIHEKARLAAERKEPDPNECVAAFSIEMSKSQLTERMFSRMTKVMGTRIRRRKISSGEMESIWDAAAELEKYSIFIDEDGRAGIAQICARARELARKKKIRLLMIDFLQLIEPFKKNSRRDLEISEITAAIKALAKEIKCPIILLSQVKREVDDRPNKIPKASDMSEGGTVENNCDSMLTICRQETYLINEKPAQGTEKYLAWEREMRKWRGVAQVFGAKSRHGSQDVIEMGYNGPLTTFTDAPEPREVEPEEVRKDLRKDALSPLAKELHEIIKDLSMTEGSRATKEQRGHDRKVPAGAVLVKRSRVYDEFLAQVRPDDTPEQAQKAWNSASSNLRNRKAAGLFRDIDMTDYLYVLDIAN